MDYEKDYWIDTLFVAVGMLLMLVIHNRFIGLIVVALLLFAGYYLFCGCE